MDNYRTNNGTNNGKTIDKTMDTKKQWGTMGKNMENNGPGLRYKEAKVLKVRHRPSNPVDATWFPGYGGRVQKARFHQQAMSQQDWHPDGIKIGWDRLVSCCVVWYNFLLQEAMKFGQVTQHVLLVLRKLI